MTICLEPWKVMPKPHPANPLGPKIPRQRGQPGKTRLPLAKTHRPLHVGAAMPKKIATVVQKAIVPAVAADRPRWLEWRRDAKPSPARISDLDFCKMPG